MKGCSSSPRIICWKLEPGGVGLAIHAAKHFGCKVTTTTISHEQYAYACEWVKKEGLEGHITLLEKDYRELEGKFDKLVSVEMIEAVGNKYYDNYFSTCNRLLKEDGLMLIQAITISDQRFAESVKNIDFIKRYIFPGGQLPSNSVIADCIARQTDMQLIGLEDITQDYAQTLCAWRERFWQRLDEVKQLGCDDVFIRMWNYYLCFCEGGFMERVIHAGQFLIAKPDFKAVPESSKSCGKISPDEVLQPETGPPDSHPFERLTPDLVIDAVESTGLVSDARILALNSYENRVYQVVSRKSLSL